MDKKLLGIAAIGAIFILPKLSGATSAAEPTQSPASSISSPSPMPPVLPVAVPATLPQAVYHGDYASQSNNNMGLALNTQVHLGPGYIVYSANYLTDNIAATKNYNIAIATAQAGIDGANYLNMQSSQAIQGDNAMYQQRTYQGDDTRALIQSTAIMKTIADNAIIYNNLV